MRRDRQIMDRDRDSREEEEGMDVEDMAMAEVGIGRGIGIIAEIDSRGISGIRRADRTGRSGTENGMEDNGQTGEAMDMAGDEEDIIIMAEMERSGTEEEAEEGMEVDTEIEIEGGSAVIETMLIAI